MPSPATRAWIPNCHASRRRRYFSGRATGFSTKRIAPPTPICLRHRRKACGARSSSNLIRSLARSSSEARNSPGFSFFGGLDWQLLQLTQIKNMCQRYPYLRVVISPTIMGETHVENDVGFGQPFAGIAVLAAWIDRADYNPWECRAFSGACDRHRCRGRWRR